MPHPPLTLIRAVICTEISVLDSIVVSILACHVRDPGSIPGRGGLHFSIFLLFFNLATSQEKKEVPRAGFEPAT